MAQTRVVIEGSSVSASQLKDLFRMIDDGTVDNNRLQRFMENPSWGGDKTEVTLVRAISILGEKKVVGIGQAATVRGMKEFDSTARIRYSESTLRECAVQNLQAGTDWRLVYCFGFSLRELRDEIGTDPKKQPCCYANDWWLGKKEDDWATAKPESGYYLVDFAGRFARTSWHRQEQEIAKVGGKFFRTPEAIIAEAITTVFQVWNERLLENWYHWGPSLVSVGFRVCVGDFARDGWLVGHCHPDGGDLDGLRVCIARKFES